MFQLESYLSPFSLQAALALFGVIGGPILGVFTLGMLFPWANEKVGLINQ